MSGLMDRESKRSVVGSIMGGKATPPVEKETVSRCYSISVDTAKKIKMRAAMEGKKDYQIVQDALDAYLVADDNL